MSVGSDQHRVVSDNHGWVWSGSDWSLLSRISKAWVRRTFFRRYVAIRIYIAITLLVPLIKGINAVSFAFAHVPLIQRGEEVPEVDQVAKQNNQHSCEPKDVPARII